MPENRVLQILDALYEGVYTVDRSRQITYWNQGAKKITGFSSEDALGKFCHDDLLNHIDAEGRQLCLGGCPLEQAMRDGEIREIEAFLQHKRGHLIPVKTRLIPIVVSGEVVGCAEVFMEATELGTSYTQTIAMNHVAYKDQLTGLPNKVYIEKAIQARLDEYSVLEIPFGLAMADIDNFEGVNDTFGADLSDAILTLLSKTYKHTFHAAEVVGRWQNDEFVFIFTGITREQLNKQCEKIRVLSEGSTLRKEAQKEIDFTVSVGGTVARRGDTIETLVDRLRERLKKAKIKGGNNAVT